MLSRPLGYAQFGPKLGVRKLRSRDFAVDATPVEQLVVAPAPDNVTLIEDNDLVGVLDSANTLRDDEDTGIPGDRL
jgi:hypothetical protein